MEIDKIETELTEIFNTMNIPLQRRNISAKKDNLQEVSDRQHNLLWLIRNLVFQNSAHPKFERAMYCIKTLLTNN